MTSKAKKQAYKELRSVAGVHTVGGLGLFGLSFLCPPLAAAWWVHFCIAAGDTFNHAVDAARTK